MIYFLNVPEKHALIFPLDTYFMTYQSLFSRKYKKSCFKMLCPEFFTQHANVKSLNVISAYLYSYAHRILDDVRYLLLVKVHMYDKAR